MRLLPFALLLLAVPARADDVAGVVVTGEATLQPPLIAQIEGWLRQHGHSVIASPLEPDAINTLIDCFVIEDQGCARNLVEKRAKSPTIVFARVEVTPNQADGTRDATITAYWFEKGHDAFSDRRVCMRCTEQTLRVAADDLMQSLAYHATITHDQLPAAPPTGHIAVTPPTPAGDAASSHDDQQSQSPLVPYTLVGVGGAAMITGVVLLAINQSPSSTGVEQPTYRDTEGTGIVFLAAGAVSAGVGVYLWLHQRASSEPVVAVAPGGGYVGWAGRF